MLNKPGGNQMRKCGCGSGRKYKNCCAKIKQQQDAMRDLRTKLANGDIPFSARVQSDGDNACSMVVSEVSHNGRRITSDPITLSVNTEDHEKIDRSQANLSIPVDGSPATISTTGHASVNNGNATHNLCLSQNKKRMKVKSPGGLFAIIRVGKQRDTGQDYFDLLLGENGVKERIGADGKKNRPHITFHPDGNGKFIWRAEYKCNLEGSLNYDPQTKIITPSEIEITFDDFDECLRLGFQYCDQQQTVELVTANFSNNR